MYPEKPLTRPDIVGRTRYVLGDRYPHLLTACAGLPDTLLIDLASLLYSGNGWRHRMPANEAEEETLARWVHLLRQTDFQRVYASIHRSPDEISRRLALAVLLFVDEHFRTRTIPSFDFSQYPVLSPLSLFFINHADVFERDACRVAAFSFLTVCNALPRRYIRLRLTTPEGLEEAVVQKATHFPLGGYAELTTTGTLESIVPTELVTYSEVPDYFDYKIANGQLLYFARDTESESLILKRTLVLFAYLPEEFYEGIVDFAEMGHLPARMVQGTLYSLTLSLIPQTLGRVRLHWSLAGPEADRDKEWLARILGPRAGLSAVTNLKSPQDTFKTAHGRYVASLIFAPEAYADAVESYASQIWDAYRTIWLTDRLLQNPPILYREAERALSLI
ncbi:MAG: hypothetical protein V2G42_07875 [bacterium JZ-2024 1]